MSAKRSVTKHEVSLAEVRRKAERERLIIIATGVVLAVAASALPIMALTGLVEPFAGKETVVNFNLALGIASALSIVINIGQYGKGRIRHQTIKRLRGRLYEFEEAEA